MGRAAGESGGDAITVYPTFRHGSAWIGKVKWDMVQM